MSNPRRDANGLTKADRIRALIDEGFSVEEIAKKVPCGLEYVYRLKHSTNAMTAVRNGIAALQQNVLELRDRIQNLEEAAGVRPPRKRARGPQYPRDRAIMPEGWKAAPAAPQMLSGGLSNGKDS